MTAWRTTAGKTTTAVGLAPLRVNGSSPGLGELDGGLPIAGSMGLIQSVQSGRRPRRIRGILQPR